MPRSLAVPFGIIASVIYAQVVVLVTMPVAASQAGISSAVIGLLLGVPGAVSLLLDVPTAALSDARGRRQFLRPGGTILAAAGLVLAVAGADVWIWAAGMVLAFVAMAFLVSPALALITERTPTNNVSRVQGLNGSVQAAMSIGAVLVAGFLLGALLAHVSFLTVTAAGAAIALLARSLEEGGRPQRDGAFAIAFGSYPRALGLLRRPFVALAAIMSVLYGILFLVVGNAFLPSYAIAVGVSPAIVGVLLALRTGVVGLASPSFEPVVARLGILRPVIVCALLGAVGAAVVPLAGFAQPVLVAAVVLQGIGLTYSVAASNLWITAGTDTDARASAVATTNLGSRLVLLVLAPLFGILTDLDPALPFEIGALSVLACATGLCVVYWVALPTTSRERG